MGRKSIKPKLQEKKERMPTAMERETICVTSDADETWNICTASPKYKNRFEKLGYQSTPVDIVYGYVNYEVPERCVSFRSMKKKTVSPKVKEALLKARLSRKSVVDTENSEVK